MPARQVIVRLGRLEQLGAEGVVDWLVASQKRYSHQQWLRIEALRAERDYPSGTVLVFRRLWEELGLAEALQPAPHLQPLN